MYIILPKCVKDCGKAMVLYNDLCPVTLNSYMHKLYVNVYNPVNIPIVGTDVWLV